MKSSSEVLTLIKAVGQLRELIDDFSELSKKNPDSIVNKFKLSLVNQVLGIFNSMIDETSKPFQDFLLFSDENLPTNSDVLIILGQYFSCIKQFIERNTSFFDFKTYWVINGKRSDIDIKTNELLGEKR